MSYESREYCSSYYDIPASVKNDDAAFYVNLNETMELELEKSGVIPAGTQITVDWRSDNPDTGTVYYHTYRGDEGGYVTADSIEFDLSAVRPVEKNKLTQPIKYFVLNKDGVRLREGPNELYAEVGEVIPYGTVLEASYGAEDYTGTQDDGSYPSWCWFEYNGVSGWAYTFQWLDSFDFAFTADTFRAGTEFPYDKAMTFGEIPLYDGPDIRNADVIDTIAAGTELDFDIVYYTGGLYGYVEYNGNNGWAQVYCGFLPGDDYDKVNNRIDSYIKIAAESVPVISSPFDDCEGTGETIEKDRVLHYDYVREFEGEPDYYRVEYQGEYVWISAGFDDVEKYTPEELEKIMTDEIRSTLEEDAVDKETVTEIDSPEEDIASPVEEKSGGKVLITAVCIAAAAVVIAVAALIIKKKKNK